MNRSITTTTAGTARRDLSGFEGPLVGPEDRDYDEARKIYNAMIDKRPALIARCTGPSDVAKAIAFARNHDLPLAVRGGGHNGAGLGTCDDGVVIDLSLLRAVQVDPQARTVRVGGGCTWGEVDRATNEHGLATPSGIISTTGVGGLTLGGGIGHLTRKCGLTIDNLLEAELVLASGERVRASSDEHPDLYWAIRGGGGNFGVVTSFLFRLHEVGNVVGGPTFWPVEMSAEVLSVYREFLPSAPRELGGFFAFHTVPPAPPFPEQIHLRKVCGVVWCYAGPEEDAAMAMAPLLDNLPEPLMHGVQLMPHPALQSAFDDLYPPGDQWYWRAGGVQYALQEFRGGLLVTDGHHNRVLHVTRDGDISQLAAFGNIVPTGLAVQGRNIYMGQAGPIPHRPQDGKIVTFTPRSPATQIASGASLIVDVEFGPGCRLYALSQGIWDLPPTSENEGAPASPNTGRLLRLTRHGRLTPIAQGLDRPTSLEFIGDTAYVITLTGKVLKIHNAGKPHFGGM